MASISKLLRFQPELVKAVEQYQKENYISHFSTAVYELIREGLKASKQQ
jgi:hypothetical protein